MILDCQRRTSLFRATRWSLQRLTSNKAVDGPTSVRRRFGSDMVLFSESLFNEGELPDVILRSVPIEARPMNLEDHISGSPRSDEFKEKLSLKVVERETSGEEDV